MTRQLLATLLLSSLSLPAVAALQAGASAPDFSAQASLAGKEFHFSLKDALKNGPVVVYFYPSAFTGGCNAQAHAFAVDMEKFKAAGASVIGVSLDNIARLNAFSADPEYCGGKVPVASDADGSIAKSYELKVSPGDDAYKDTRGDKIGHGFAERTTFIVTPDGKVGSTIGGMSPTANVAQALTEVEKMASAHSPAKKK
jgi:thioredoxin-dependent peroxiredoxin